MLWCGWHGNSLPHSKARRDMLSWVEVCDVSPYDYGKVQLVPSCVSGQCRFFGVSQFVASSTELVCEDVVEHRPGVSVVDVVDEELSCSCCPFETVKAHRVEGG